MNEFLQNYNKFICQILCKSLLYILLFFDFLFQKNYGYINSLPPTSMIQFLSTLTLHSFFQPLITINFIYPVEN